MQAISDFFMWRFTDKTRVIFLVIGGVLLCLVIAIVMERKTKQTYFEHEKTDSDWSLFDDNDDEDSDK